VKIEHITRIGFSAWRSSEQQRHLSISDGLLGKIVIDDKSVFAVISEIFSNSAAGIWGQELKGSGLGGSGSNDDSVLEGIMLAKSLDDVGNS